MDADSSPSRQPPRPPVPAAPNGGGTVEPANRAIVAKERYQTPLEAPALRYEMRDPLAEVTYRTNSFIEMVAKANQLGSSRFVAIDEQGKRTTIQTKAGRWPEPPSAEEARSTSQPSSRSADHPEPGAAARPPAPVTPPPRGPAPSHPEQAEPTRSRAGQAPSPLTPLSGIDAKAERAALVTRLEAGLAERYVVKRAPIKIGDLNIGRTEYRYRGDTTRVAFTESTFRLATDTNNPSVARSMVDVAQARNWRALRVSGNEDFKRLVWLEANARGVKTLGYEPGPADLDLLKREREARLVNRIEPERAAAGQSLAAGSAATPTSSSTSKSSQRGGAGRKTVLAAIEAVLVAKGVSQAKRDAVMAAAAEKLEQRIRAGQAPKVKVYDPAAPSQRPAIARVPQPQPTRDRPPPSR